MIFLYSIFIKFYFFLLWISHFFSAKSKLWIEGRKHIWKQLSEKDIKGCIWFHCASLGEFEQVNYLISQLKKQEPTSKILITFFSPSGYEIRKNYIHADIITYLPWENQKDIMKFINIVQPKMVFWVRYEFWYFILKELHNRKIPLILINGVFRKTISSLYKPFLKKVLTFFTDIFVISTESSHNLLQLGIHSLVLPDTRYDRMIQVRDESYENEWIQSFVTNHKVIVCGSTWREDEKLILEVSKDSKDIKWILVPHNVTKETIDFLKTNFTNSSLLSAVHPENVNVQFLIVDSIGLLSKIYRYADISYVGGGFNKVVHSTLEPLAYAAPILMGPNISKSEDALELVELKLAYQIKDLESFRSQINNLINQGDGKNNLRKTIFEERKGSVLKILAFIKKNIDF